MTASTATWSAEDVQSFINEYFLAWEGTDIDHIMSYYSEDVVLQIPGTLMEGSEAVREQFVRPFITAFPGNRHLVKNMLFGRGVVSVEWSFEARHKGPFEGHPPTDAQVKLPGSGVYEYDSSKRQITAARIYFDVGTLLQNITDLPAYDLKTAEEALQANQRNLSLIINTMPVLAWSTRPDGSVDFLNQRWTDYTGLSSDQTRDWGWTAAIHPGDLQQLTEYWRSIMTTGEPGEIEARLRRFDGSYRWFLFRANPLRDESGRIVRWYGTNTDIEDRKRVEEILRARELSWRQIVDNIPGLVATMSPMGEVEFLNRQTLDYFGKTNEDLKNWSLTGAVHPDDLPRAIEARKQSIDSGQIYEVEHRCRRADGVYRWFQVRGLPVLDVDNQITAWYLLLTDIDDRKQAEEALRLNEQNLSVMINAIPTFIHALRADGSVLYVNQSVLDYHGCTLEEVQREDYRARFFHPEDVERLRKERNAALTRAVPFENEQRVLGKDGKYRWFLIRYSPVLNEQGAIDRWYVVGYDIEDRKRTEDAQARHSGVRADVSAAFSKPTHLAEILRGCTEAIVRHLDAAFARIWMLNKDESMLELQASAGMYTRLDGSYSRIPVGDLKVGWIAKEKKAHLTNDVLNDPRVNDKGWAQDTGMVAFAGYPLVVEDRLIGVVALFARRPLPESILDTLASIADTIAQGIERKRAEEGLRNALEEIQKSESKLRQVIDAIPALAWCNLPDGPNEFLSKGWHEYTGLSEEESHGWGWQKAFHPEDLKLLMEKWMKMLVSGEPDDVEARLRRHDGVYRWFLIRAEPFRDESGNIVRWYGTSTDIDDRKRAEEELRRSEAILAEAQRVSKTGSFITDLLSDEHQWSEELCRIFELNPGTKITSEGIRALFHPEDLPVYEEAFKRAVDADQDIDITYRIITPAGKVKHLHAVSHLMERSAQPVYIGAIQDVTDSKAAEAALTRARTELAHMARVTTLSALTASIAHEINQPISAAITSAGACVRWLDRDQPEVQRAREAAKRIEDDGRRAAEIISHLKSFYKKDPSPEREMVSVNDVVREMPVLLRSEADRHSVTMSTDLTANLPSVNGDRVQLRQVLMNLMLNGMEAMSEQAGELTIRTRLDAGNVVVSVSDTGVGLPSDKLEEIFNAFFTTKAEGTGMGLAISSTIIESHGGRLWATSNPGPGATFHFTLPTESEA